MRTENLNQQLRNFLKISFVVFFVTMCSLLIKGSLRDFMQECSLFVFILASVFLLIEISESQEFLKISLPAKKSPRVSQYFFLIVAIALGSAYVAHIYGLTASVKNTNELLTLTEKRTIHVMEVTITRNLFLVVASIAIPLKIIGDNNPIKWLLSGTNKEN